MRRLGLRRGARRDANYTGAITLGLFAGTALGALWISSARHLGAASTLITVLVGGGAPVGVYLAWATYRDARDSRGTLSMGQVADAFAATVRAQWEAEATARRLNDPYPLPVQWAAAEPALVDSWHDIRMLAISGAGHVPSQAMWANAPADLVGRGKQLADVLERVPTRRLLVLGESGAGKTMLVVRLLLDMLERRGAGGPVPALISAASWDPAARGFREWLTDKLRIDYPAFVASPPPGVGGQDYIEALLDLRMIVLLVDGLDEIPAQVRGQAIARINDAMRPGQSVVVTSRTPQYREAVQASPRGATTLRGALGIELCPLDPAVSVAYLEVDAGGAVGAARWASVRAAIGRGGTMARALSNPLMVGLARVIYNPRPGEHLGSLPDPAALLELEIQGDIESHLLDGFIPASYRASWNDSERRSSWTAESAGEWLNFLASQLDRSGGPPDISWWELSRSLPRGKFTFGIGLLTAGACGLTGGVALWASVAFNGAWLGLIFGVTLGILTGCLSGFMAWRRFDADQPPSRRVRWRFIGGKLARRRAFGLLFGLSFGLIFGLSFGTAVGYGMYEADVYDVFRDPGSLAIGISLGAAFALISGLAGVLAFSLEEVPAEISSGVSPRTTLLHDRNAALISGFGFALFTALALSLALPDILGFAGGVTDSIPSGLKGMWSDGLLVTRHFAEPGNQVLHLQIAMGATLAVSAWLVFGLAASQSVWPRWFVARCWLAAGGRLPWRLTAFLSDAHRRGVLRQQGAVYQFRHFELQRRLAAVACAAKAQSPQADSPIPFRNRNGAGRRIAAVVTTAAVISAGAVFVAWQSRPAAPAPGRPEIRETGATVIFGCTQVPQIMPRVYRMSCATGQQEITAIHWSRWTSSSAAGAGRISTDDCLPDCADGKNIVYPVLITLSDPRKSRRGVNYFTEMVLSGPTIYSSSYPLGLTGANLY